MIQRTKPFQSTPLPPVSKESATSLDGCWLFCRAAKEALPDDAADWSTVMVPWDTADMTALEAYDWEKGVDDSQTSVAACYWKRNFIVPAFPADRKLFLRFEGAAHHTQVWVNETYFGEHKGSFSTWELEIGSVVSPESEARLLVRTIDDARLCPHNSGGLIKPVLLVQREEAHLTRLHVNGQADGSLHVTMQANREGIVALSLESPRGDVESLGSVALRAKKDSTHKYIISKVTTWDAEHPNLYKLTAKYQAAGGSICEASIRFGFRSILITGNKVTVNGMPIKLRGICRNDCDPANGKAVSIQRLRNELRLYQEANINFIRTIGHPASEALLNLCDEMGFYVQNDIALHGIDQPPQPPTQHDPAFLHEYLTAVSEVLERDISHPCILIWSLGSQSCWGTNFKLCMEFLRTRDTSRPISFSYPMTFQGEADQPDVWAVQYAAWNTKLDKMYDHMLIGHTFGIADPPGYALGSASGPVRPVFHEQIAPVPCVNREEQQRDPAVRDFWGQTILRLWREIMKTPDALGCAIDSGVDLVRIYGDEIRGKECGILDAWLRPKPEYFYVRTAYCPIRVSKQAGNKLVLTNEYNHSNLNEVLIRWHGQGSSGLMNGCNALPGHSGTIILPDFVDSITLIDSKGIELGSYSLADIAITPQAKSRVSDSAPRIERSDNILRVSGQEYVAEFCTSNGLLRSLCVSGTPLLHGGPYLNATGIQLPPWQCIRLEAMHEDKLAVIITTGQYGDVIQATFRISFNYEGEMDICCVIDKIWVHSPRRVKIHIGLDPGGLDELGIWFLADARMNTFRWHGLSDPLLNGAIYPEDHIGRPSGITKRESSALQTAALEPLTSWGEDSVHRALFGPFALPHKGSNDFRSTKSRILWACLSGKSGTKLLIRGDGKDAVRLEASPSLVHPFAPAIQYTGEWWKVEDRSGASYGMEMQSALPGSKAHFTFIGTGVVWYGPLDVIGGIAKVYLDGILQREVSQAYDKLEESGFSRGYEKRHNRIIFSVSGLRRCEHTLTIEVTGRKETRADYAYVMIDSFEVLDEEPLPLRLIINKQVNYTRLAWGNYVRSPIWVSDGDSFHTALAIQHKGVEAL